MNCLFLLLLFFLLFFIVLVIFLLGIVNRLARVLVTTLILHDVHRVLALIQRHVLLRGSGRTVVLVVIYLLINCVVGHRTTLEAGGCVIVLELFRFLSSLVFALIRLLCRLRSILCDTILILITAHKLGI